VPVLLLGIADVINGQAGQDKTQIDIVKVRNGMDRIVKLIPQRSQQWVFDLGFPLWSQCSGNCSSGGRCGTGRERSGASCTGASKNIKACS
jgi:hypothetical protein